MSSTPALAISDIIFPEASKSLSSTLTSLKRSNLSITNRLRSITQDAEFVHQVAERHHFPLVANERCGSWYIPEGMKAGSVYFKSTDGHFGQWSFNLRRLNVHLLDLITEHGGCIIVDSTRRGKSMPDALSKTIPIWISVLNRCLFPEQQDSHALKTPVDVVSRSEHAQIETRLAQLVESVARLELDCDTLRSKLHEKPLEPFWITPESDMQSLISPNAHRNLVILCTASGQTRLSHSAMFDYVQGAADDSESWACGLDAPTFWAHAELLMSTAEDDLPFTINTLMVKTKANGEFRRPITIGSTGVSIGNNASAESISGEFDIVVSCSKTPSTMLADTLRNRYIHLVCTTGKVGSRQLRDQLWKVDRLRDARSRNNKILVTCSSGRDLAVGVALAIVCLSPNLGDTTSADEMGRELTKAVIKQKLSWIVLSMPEAAPSRATLQSVNAFLLGQQMNRPP